MNNHNTKAAHDHSVEDEFDLFGAFNQKYNFEEDRRTKNDQTYLDKDKENGFDFFAVDNNTNMDNFQRNNDENTNSNTDKIGFWVRHKIHE